MDMHENEEQVVYESQPGEDLNDLEEISKKMPEIQMWVMMYKSTINDRRKMNGKQIIMNQSTRMMKKRRDSGF